MGYTHLTTYERGKIEERVHLGFSKRKIGLKLNQSPSTIGRELKRIFDGKGYDVKKTKACYEVHRTHSVWDGKWTEERLERIADSLLLSHQIKPPIPWRRIQ